MEDDFKNLHKEFHEKMNLIKRLGGLRINILHVLDENGPGNGAKITNTIQSDQESCKTPNNGQKNFRPLPGSLYPMLKKMVTEGLIIKREDGSYELTENGQKSINKIYGRFRPTGKMDRGEYSIKNSLTEIERHIDYLSVIKEENLVPYRELIEELSKKLKNIGDSLK
jgi:DNA-binding PadR family transcriptional regulator